LLNGAVGLSASNLGPHAHTWTRVSTNGLVGDLTGSIAGNNARIQITPTEALEFMGGGVQDDIATTDEDTPIMIFALANDELDGGIGGLGDLDISAATQPAEGLVTTNAQFLTYDPTGSALLQALLPGQTSTQIFQYTAFNANTLNGATATVTIIVHGLASFSDGLVAHWTFDDADVSGSTVFDLADDPGFGKGDHDATLFGGLRPNNDLPGDPDGGPVGNIFDANGADYGVVDTFSGGAHQSDLDAGEQLTVAGWFRERPDGNEEPYISKFGDNNLGWDIRRSGSSSFVRGDLRGSDGNDNTTPWPITSENNGGPWYFFSMTYTRESDFYSVQRFFSADSEAADRGLRQRGGDIFHSPDNDVGATESMVIFGGRDVSNNDTTPPAVDRLSSTKMDDIAIWNRGLSHTELTAWYGLSYYSGLKATDNAIAALVDGPVGLSVSNLGPHAHIWTKISTNGTMGDLSGAISNQTARIQITPTEALVYSRLGVEDDFALTDEASPISIPVLNNDEIDGAAGELNGLTITLVTQPADGLVTINLGNQSLTFDPTGSTLLEALLVGQSSTQSFDYTVQNTGTLTTVNGSVTVVVNGLASFGDSLVAHWSFDDADASGATVFDLADDPGFGRGDHDATLFGGLRPNTDRPGDRDFSQLLNGAWPG
ncbi:MAG: Ig-like domain-containing protein, partial [Verrucomicrobiota bacterium]